MLFRECVWKYRHVCRLVGHMKVFPVQINRIIYCITVKAALLRDEWKKSLTFTLNWQTLHTRDVTTNRNPSDFNRNSFSQIRQTQTHGERKKEWKLSYFWPWLILLNLREIVAVFFLSSAFAIRFSLPPNPTLNHDCWFLEIILFH